MFGHFGYFLNAIFFFTKSLVEKNKEMALYRSRAYSRVKLRHPKNFILTLDDEIANASTYQIPKITLPSKLEIRGDTISHFVHQKSIRYLGEQRLHNSILAHVGANRKFLYPLPPWWIEKIEGLQIEVDQKNSHTLWRLFCFYFFLRSTTDGLIRFLKNAFLNREMVQWKVSKYDYFLNLRKSNVEPFTGDKIKYNILYWHSIWTQKSSNFTKSCSPNNVYYECDENIRSFTYKNIRYRQLNAKFPVIISVKDKCFFFLWLALFWLKNAFLTFTNRQHEAFLFADIVESMYVTFLYDNQLAENYFFHNETYLFKPLWTFVAEKKGSTCWLYFYSANNFHFDREGVKLYDRHLKLVSWKNVITWHNDHKKILTNASDKIDLVDISPCIWFEDPTPTCSEQAHNKIDLLIFDVVPRRPFFYTRLISNSEIYDEKNVIKFISDIEHVLKRNSIKGVIKQKRKANVSTSKKYIRFLDKTMVQGSITSVNADVAAASLMTNSKFVICYPFTTAALVAKFYGIPVVFYDPTGLIKIGKRFFDIDIIQNVEELELRVLGAMG